MLRKFPSVFFRIAFVSRRILRPVLQQFMPDKRPQDNITINAFSPCEEEHPLTNLTALSGMQSFFLLLFDTDDVDIIIIISSSNSSSIMIIIL